VEAKSWIKTLKQTIQYKKTLLHVRAITRHCIAYIVGKGVGGGQNDHFKLFLKFWHMQEGYRRVRLHVVIDNRHTCYHAVTTQHRYLHYREIVND